MLDYRMYTFLKLCEGLNYRVTAEQLNMTQPAVTQHIQFLEREYGCKLFDYSNRKLVKTKAGEKMEIYARAAVYNEKALHNEIISQKIMKLRVGATKSIGGYDIREQLKRIANDDSIELSLIVDNTMALLKKLENSELDFALIEGYFDKGKYGYSLYKEVEFIGICAKNHRFAGKTIKAEEIFNENIIVREPGSGTRAILKQLLKSRDYSLADFRKRITVSSFGVIKYLVSENCGISFVYDVVAHKQNNLSTFTVEGTKVIREFNFVYLKGTDAGKLTELFR